MGVTRLTRARPGEPLASEAESPRERWLSPELVKGLEFDLVVLVEQETFDDGVVGAVDRYVSMMPATGQLVLVVGASSSGG